MRLSNVLLRFYVKGDILTSVCRGRYYIQYKMGLSRQEVNLRRLLAKCELLIKNNQKEDERFPKYINSLEEMIKEIKSQSIPNDNIPDYIKRIKSLKFQLGMISDEELAAENSEKQNLNSREELFEVRKRNVGKTDHSGDLDQVLNFHQNMHEKIAEEMLELTSSLKEHTTLANKIIKKDTETIGRSQLTQLTDHNFSKLKVESDKLSEHSKRAWKCWMWVLLVIVMVVFINMVLFMKVMKKK
ncbi:Membrane fusion protein Use1 [Popillia japonica]|uniref:Vesicle transport protein USE1 n=1 Tax=Popillia japonica TaxID=7064 RepID=A0AAW1HV04_POPJA